MDKSVLTIIVRNLLQIRKLDTFTVKSQWLENLWDHGNLFEQRVVRATEDSSWHYVRKQMVIIKGSLFDLLYNNLMLRVLIRIALIILMNTHNIQFHYKIRKFP